MYLPPSYRIASGKILVGKKKDTIILAGKQMSALTSTELQHTGCIYKIKINAAKESAFSFSVVLVCEGCRLGRWAAAVVDQNNLSFWCYVHSV